jgi:hypothetical protein
MCENLLKKAEKAEKEYDTTCMAMATIMMSLNAIDSFLTDFAYYIKPEIFSNNFINNNIPNKFKILFAKELKDEFPEIENYEKLELALSTSNHILKKADSLKKLQT